MVASTAVFIGHRDYDDSLDDRIEQAIERLVRRGYKYFLCGGMGDFDLACARCVSGMKWKYPHMRLYLVQYTSGWIPEEYEYYDGAILPQWEEAPQPGQEIVFRNQYMIEKSSAAVCWVNRHRGGANLSWRYAQKMGLYMIHILP